MAEAKMSVTRLAMLIVGGIVAMILCIALMEMWVNVDAREIVVIQAPGGSLEVVTDPGLKWQGFGKVTRYPRLATFSFSAHKDQGAVLDESIVTQFNDGGHANISGTVNFMMPLQPDKIIKLHKDYNNIGAIEQNLIRQVMQKVIYNVGPTMSSTESAAEKRPQIPAYIDDQLVNGPYLTKAVQQMVKDPITNQDKLMNVLMIALDEKGKPQRESESPITVYGIQLQAVSINGVFYDKPVQDQIRQRQEAATAVQLSIANAKKAEQDAITTTKQGEANAAKAKWEQEVVNAKVIAEAEQKVKVAQAEVQAAELFKKSETLKGEGEAARKRAVMEADGQLDKRLDAVIKINQMYADAIKEAQPGAWSPSVVMGGNGQANGGSNASTLVDLMTAKTAREVGLDLSVRSGKAAAPAAKK